LAQRKAKSKSEVTHCQIMYWVQFNTANYNNHERALTAKKINRQLFFHNSNRKCYKSPR